MGELTPIHFEYECRFLGQDLKPFETIPFTCVSDSEASEACADLLKQHTNRAAFAGFELFRDGRRLFVRLMSSEPAPLGVPAASAQTQAI